MVVWIVLGLASCASFICALQDVFQSLLSRLEARAAAARKDRVNSVVSDRPTAAAAGTSDDQQLDVSPPSDVTELDNLRNRNV